MFIGKPRIFQQFPEIIFGFSKKCTINKEDPFNFNMSKGIGDSDGIVEHNRSLYFDKIGLSDESVIIQKQIHSDIVNIVDRYTTDLIGDALITLKSKLGLAVSAADCTNIYLYDPVNRIVSSVHSGWAGTEKRILEKTLQILKENFYSKAENLFAYLGPSISVENYEVGNNFKDKFDKKYLIPFDGKYKFDLKKSNYDMLRKEGIPEKQIEVSEICSYENMQFHSFRRDKSSAGRALGVIAIK